VSAIAKGVTLLNVVAGLTTPITHLAIVLAPSMYGMIADGDLSSTASLALEVGGLMHVVVNTTANASYGVSGGKAVRTSIHGQAFILEGLF